MDLREWLKDVKLKFKKGNKLVSEPKEPLFKKWILEEIKYRYNIGSMRKNNVYLSCNRPLRGQGGKTFQGRLQPNGGLFRKSARSRKGF